MNGVDPLLIVLVIAVLGLMFWDWYGIIKNERK